MATDPLDFAVDLDSIRTRLEGLGYFLSVSDILTATEALDGTIAAQPPAAFVAVSRERAEENRLIGAHRQRVRVTVAVLFVESAARMDRATADAFERTRKAVTRQLVAWRPNGAERALQYEAYRVVSVGDGLVWGEVTFTTDYQLTTAT